MASLKSNKAKQSVFIVLKDQWIICLGARMGTETGYQQSKKAFK